MRCERLPQTCLLTQRVSREGWSVKALHPSSFVIRSSHAEEEKGVWGLWNTPNEINSMQLQFSQTDFQCVKYSDIIL